MCTKYRYGQPRPESVKFDGELLVSDSCKGPVTLAPTDRGPVITADLPDEVQLMHFGLLPHTALELSAQKYMNAKAETVLEKQTFRPLMRHHKRCLVVSDGFYDSRKEGKARIPMFFSLPGRQSFCYAGLWSRWKSADGLTVYDSYAILTVEPNELVSPIHHRMPVILHQQDEAKWLDKTASMESLLELCVPFPQELMAMEEGPIDLHKKKTAQLNF
jgi:putative SOS response-associated peptidase YedK